VRRTNKDIICQIAYSKIKGDIVVCAAYSHELPKYGIPVGLTNYAAAYATGLLCARRMLASLGMAEMYEGVTEVTGQEYHVENQVEEKQPFKCFLDIGLARTTTGARIFGALKGAVDGGLHIPHSVKRFPGYKKGEYKAEIHREWIFGGPVRNYMKFLKENRPERYSAQFSQFIKHGIEADALEAMYAEAHKKIRADPTYTKKETKSYAERKDWRKQHKLTLEQRKERVQQKLELLKQQVLARAQQQDDEEILESEDASNETSEEDD